MSRPRLAMSSQEAFKQDIERQLSAFEEREKQFRARERQERVIVTMALQNSQPLAMGSQFSPLGFVE